MGDGGAPHPVPWALTGGPGAAVESIRRLMVAGELDPAPSAVASLLLAAAGPAPPSPAPGGRGGAAAKAAAAAAEAAKAAAAARRRRAQLLDGWTAKTAAEGPVEVRADGQSLNRSALTESLGAH